MFLIELAVSSFIMVQDFKGNRTQVILDVYWPGQICIDSKELEEKFPKMGKLPGGRFHYNPRRNSWEKCL
jgi:hypothetical protein